MTHLGVQWELLLGLMFAPEKIDPLLSSFPIVLPCNNYTNCHYGANLSQRKPTLIMDLVQGPPLNRELVNGSHLLIVQNLPRPKWTLM